MTAAELARWSVIIIAAWMCLCVLYAATRAPGNFGGRLVAFVMYVWIVVAACLWWQP